MKKKDNILGLRLTAGEGVPGRMIQPSIGWALIEKNNNNKVDYDKMDNLTENDVINQGRKALGLYFKSLREGKELSYYAVSKSSSLSINQIQSIEEGNASYTIDSFLRICRGLDCYILLKDRNGHHLDEDDMIDKI